LRGTGTADYARASLADEAVKPAAATRWPGTEQPQREARDMGMPIIEAFGSRLAASRSFDAALDLLAEEALGLGLDGVDYAFLPSIHLLTGGWARGPIFARNFPLRWQAGWMRHGRFDPILPLTYRRGLPVDWQVVKGHPGLTDAQRAALAFLESGMGFPGGITVPIHLPGNRFAFVSGVSRRAGADWAALSAASMVPLMALAHTFHHIVATHFPPPTGNDTLRLTRRELECLQFAANGCSAPATARLLNRSVDTVRRHLKHAMAKLGARTIAQSVAIGASCGLLDVDCGPFACAPDDSRQRSAARP
jgi:LuxR family transcriptional regulator